MKKCEKAVEVFEAKAKKIIFKYSSHVYQQTGNYSYIRLLGFFYNFNLTLLQVDEELHRESRHIINKYQHNEQVDILHLLETLNERRAMARLEFIRYQSPAHNY